MATEVLTDKENYVAEDLQSVMKQNSAPISKHQAIHLKK